MSSKFFKKLTHIEVSIAMAIMIVFAAILTYYNIIIGICGFFAIAFLFFYTRKMAKKRHQGMQEYLRELKGELDVTIENAVIENPMAICMINSHSEILWHNEKFNEIMEIADGEPLNLEYATFVENPDNTTIMSLGDKSYRLYVTMRKDSPENIMIHWLDVTSHEALKTLYKDERNCFMYVNVDNYDDLIASSPDEQKSILSAKIESTIRQWISKMNASTTKYDDGKYFIVFENKYLEQMESSRFNILDEVREIETDADFPVSLSIGIGTHGRTPLQRDEYAVAALDMALGRGGDQAVVKKLNKMEYYGGKLQTVEKRNKGKSRIMAHALKQMVDQSSKVIIMAHKKPDTDSFGSALGIYRIALNRYKESYIVINDMNDTLEPLYEEAVQTERYNFINSDEALSLIDKESLLVVVDTNRPSLTECPELLNRTDKIVVIDHHRKTEESIENATLTYMETYASSASELITEILQYIGDKKDIEKLEVEALLAGIVVDTKNFSVNTGVRTFEAASWLRRIGADTAMVRQFFKTDVVMFKMKAETVINAKHLDNGIAISECRGKHKDMHILTSQAADELLNIKGVRAAFVVGQDEDGGSVVSARSLKEVNVQTVLEKLGGGGHLTTAGAQLRVPPQETCQLIEDTIKEMEI